MRDNNVDSLNNMTTPWPIKFTPGAKPGQKHPINDVNTINKKQKYESNRSGHEFKETWL